MAKLAEVKKHGFATIKKPESPYNDENIEYVENVNQRITVNPDVAKQAIRSILLSEISEYVKGAFTLTCENINNMIEKYNRELLTYTENKIAASAQTLAEQLITRVIKEKMSDEFIDNLIRELESIKNNGNSDMFSATK